MVSTKHAASLPTPNALSIRSLKRPGAAAPVASALSATTAIGQPRRSFSKFLGGMAVASLLLVGSARAQVLQTNSYPGAVKSNGNFIVVKTFGQSQTIWEWQNTATAGSWLNHGTFGPRSLVFEEPRALTAQGGFQITTRATSGLETVAWQPGGPAISLQRPTFNPSYMSSPSEVMFGNRTMYVVDQGLYQQIGNQPNWSRLGPTSGKPLLNIAPAIMGDGRVFVSKADGEVFQVWWTGTSWHWYSHGYARQPDWLGRGGVKPVSFGGAMPVSGTIFMRCDDGTLRDIHAVGPNWAWTDHGKPWGWNVSSAPTATSEGSVFVTGTLGGTTYLFQRVRVGSSWSWNNHGNPGVNLTGAPAAHYNSERVVARGINGVHYMLTKGPTGLWSWKTCGAP